MALPGLNWLPGVQRWQAHNPAIRVEWSCHALQAADGSWVMVDPIGSPADLGWKDEEGPRVAAVVATNGNHERAAVEWVHQGRVRLWAASGSGLDSPTWRPLPHGPGWQDDWIVEDLTGGGPGEVALRIPRLDLMVFGDAVVNLAGRGLELLPDRYCTDPAHLRKAILRLVQTPFARAVFAHGDPIEEGASQSIAALLR